MSKLARLTIVLSLAWIVIASPSIYFYSIKEANESANVLLDYCKSMQSSYPKEVDYMDRCKKESNKIYENQVSNIYLETTFLTFIPLAFFILSGYVIRKSIKWVKSGS